VGVRNFVALLAQGGCDTIAFVDTASDIDIAQSVGVNGGNLPDDVRTIQQALNRVPPSSGGPLPALDVDGLCGPKTEQAIATFQRRQFGWADGRVDPRQVTIARLKEFQDDASAARGVSPPAAPASKPKKTVSAAPTTVSKPQVMARVYAAIPDALAWIFAAQFTLDRARDLLLGRGGGLLEAAKKKNFALVNKYFHLDKLPKPEAIASINRMHRLYANMRTAIGHNSQATTIGTGFIQEDPTASNKPDSSYLAFTHFGGFTRVNPKTGKPRMSREDNYVGSNLREDSVFICTAALETYNREAVIHTLVHELAHYTGPEIDRPDRIGDLSDRGKPNFLWLDPSVALRVADCYSGFAAEAKLGRPLHEVNLGF
jgi:hypothetical protein